jgi:hypothetical protein
MRRQRLSALLLKPSTWVVPYVALWFVVGLLPFQPTDLDIFFWPSAKLAVAGHPLLVYAAAGHDAYPNANGPLALVPLSAVGVILNAFGWLDASTQRRAVAMAVFSVFLLLMSREAVHAIERIRGRNLTAYPRLFAYAVIALSPQAWQSVAGYGHIEQPIEIWLLLIAARLVDREQAGRAGIAFALAVLSRSSAVLLAVPLGLASLQRRRTAALRFLVAGAVTGVAGLLPFVIADPADVIHSLFTYRGGLVVGAGSIWSLTYGSGVEDVVKHWDIAAVVAAGLAANLWLATRPGGLNRARLLAAMTLSSASFALLAKTVWPYYLFEVFVFGTVWAFGRWKPADGVVRLILAPLAISVFGMVAEVGSETGLATRPVQLEGAGMFAMLGLTAAWILWVSSGGVRREAGISASPPTLDRHGYGSERAD